MALFEPGKVLKTKLGAPVTIVKHLGSGGQGDVYCVEYQGVQKALKWYKQDALRNPEAFYKNLSHNISKGSPDEAFLWPETITEITEGSFGYIMDLVSEGFYELRKIMASRALNFASFRVATEACIEIVSAFKILHYNGYSYQDLNDGNFFINVQNGKVLISDCDNVAPNGTNMGVLGKPRYMAPEIVAGRGKVLPNTQSDRYSLAAILFLILFMSHPLEGKRWLVPCMNDTYAEKLYGTAPLFICDPNDSSNGPVKNIHENIIKRWEFMPQYLKDAFLKAFDQEALKNPERRLREFDWLNVLVRFRSDIVKCVCGNEVFVKNAMSIKCEVCGKIVNVKHKITLPNYSITAAKGTRVYRCQLGLCNLDDALTPVARITVKNDDPNVIGFKNMTPDILLAKTPSGKTKQIPPQGIVPFKSGIEIEAFDKKIVLE